MMSVRYTLDVEGQQFVVDVEEEGPDRFRVIVNGRALSVRLVSEGEMALTRPGEKAPEQVSGETTRSGAARAVAEVRAPIPGTILSVEVSPGQEVKYGDTLVVLEAMKMKNLIRSPRDGRVGEVLVQPGQSVMHNDVLVRFEQ